MSRIDDYLAEHASRFEDELCEFLRIPSVSADPQHKADVAEAARWVADHLSRLGFAVEVIPTKGHPLVYAESPAVPGAPTALVYGHYDVQPADPLEKWITPPFEPTRREGNIYARGATDDKGQMLTHVKSAEAWIAAEGRLPINLKYIIEGEEEIGSPNLPKWLEANRELVAADVVVISDTAQFGPDLPSICTGLRGIAAFEIEIQTASSDLHSGSFGGAVPNAIEVLTRLLTALHTPDGRVDVPGFYDDVAEPSDEEKASWKALPFCEQEFLATAGAKATWGESDRSILERLWSRPTLEFVGISGGYQGQGHKGIVPARALAKCSARLVPNQDPAKVIEAVRRRVQALCPPYAELHWRAGHGTPAVSIPTDSKWVKAAVQALEAGFGRAPVFIREGGSISIVTRFVRDLAMPCLLLGFGLPDDRIHSPNEKFRLEDFVRGMRTSAHLLAKLAEDRAPAVVLGQQLALQDEMH